MKDFYLQTRIFPPVCLAFIIILQVSCTQNNSQQVETGVKTDTLPPPIVITAGVPKIVSIDTCLPPNHVVFPVKDSIDHVFNSYKGPFHVKLGPPTIKPADFFIEM